MESKIALVLNEEQLDHLSMLVAADLVGLEEISDWSDYPVEDPELALKYRFHFMSKHSLNRQIAEKIDAIFLQIDKMKALERFR